MKEIPIGTESSAGEVLCSTIFLPSGKKLLSKGHRINEEEVKTLRSHDVKMVSVIRLEEGDVAENEAVMSVATEASSGSADILLVASGRAKVCANTPCCVLVDDDLLKELNCMPGATIATLPNFTYVSPGDRIAIIKSNPFFVRQEQLNAIVCTLREKGPILQARAIHSPLIGVVYTDPIVGEKSQELFDSVMRQRLKRLNCEPSFVLTAVENEVAVANALTYLLRVRPSVIVIASTTCPAGPADVIGRAMVRAGCSLEKFMAPVDPGDLLLMGYKEETAVVSSPGCFRSAKPNVLDFILPPMLAHYRVSAWEIACLGNRGLSI